MASPRRQGQPDVLCESIGKLITIEHCSMPDTARLEIVDRRPRVLYLNPAASDYDRHTALVEVLAVLLVGPEAAVSARHIRPRHLHAVS